MVSMRSTHDDKGRLAFGRACAALALLLLAGCAREIHEYPPAWPQVLQAYDCASLLGTYENEGEGSGFRKETLVGILDFQRLRARERPAQWVGLSMPGGGLLEVRDPDGRLRFVAEKGEFGCDEGRLHVWYSDGGAGNVGAAWGWVTVDLTKDADGWLVARIDESAVALLGYVIPAYIGGTRWYRFRPTPP
jgi:hypothetical protein